MSSREWMGGAQTAGEKRREACVSLRPSGALVRAALVAALWVVASAGQARPTQGRHSIDRRVEHVLFLSRARGTQGLTASERARRISYRTRLHYQPRAQSEDGSPAGCHTLTGMSRNYWVYIMASVWKVLYVGVTNDLVRRADQHKRSQLPAFSARYRVNRLVWFENTQDVRIAIEREKQVKGWSRRRKLQLVETVNPGWLDLARDWDSDERT